MTVETSQHNLTPFEKFRENSYARWSLCRRLADSVTLPTHTARRYDAAMRSAGVLLLCCLAIGSVFADETNLTLTVDGVTYSNVTFGTVTPTSVTIFYRSGIATVPLQKLPDELQQRFGSSAEKAKQDQIGQQRKAQEAEIQQCYLVAKRNLRDTQRATELYNSKDQQTIAAFVELDKQFIDAYEAGDLAKARGLWQTKLDRIQKFISTKQIYGYEYNELLGHDVTVPIDYGLFSNADEFYLRVGDGTISVLATVSPTEVEDMLKTLPKAFDWSVTCVEKKLDTSKPLGSWTGLSFDFISTEGGDVCYLRLTAKGEFSEDHLLQTKKVRVNLLDLQALLYQLSKSYDLFQDREKERRNSEFLK